MNHFCISTSSWVYPHLAFALTPAVLMFTGVIKIPELESERHRFGQVIGTAKVNTPWIWHAETWGQRGGFRTIFSCMNTCSVWFLFGLMLNLPRFDTYMVKAVPQCWFLGFTGWYFISQCVFSFPFFFILQAYSPIPSKKSKHDRSRSPSMDKEKQADWLQSLAASANKVHFIGLLFSLWNLLSR